MPSRARAALVLRAFDNPTDEEIAARLRVSRGAARAAISRGLAKLRESGADETTFTRSNWTLTPEPGDVRRIVREASRQSRWRRAKVALVGVAVAGVAAMVAVVVQSVDGDSPATQPEPGDPLREPQIESITSVDELSLIFPGVTLQEIPLLDFGDGRVFEPRAVDESGRIVGTIVGSTPPVAEQIAVFDPASGEVSFMAEPRRRTVPAFYANDSVIVWAESDDLEIDPFTSELSWRCVDRASSVVHEIDLPEQRADGPRYNVALVAIAVDGRIAVSRSSSGVSPDLYLADACGSAFELLAEGAVAPQFAGGSLFYLNDDGIWRNGVTGTPLFVAERPPGAELSSPRYGASDSVVMWFLSRRGSDDPWSYAVTRPDGSDRLTVETPPGFLAPYAANSWALAGALIDPAADPDQPAFGAWIYAPDLGSIAMLGPTTEENPVLYVVAAAGDHLLMAQADSAGSTRWWLVTLS